MSKRRRWCWFIV